MARTKKIQASDEIINNTITDIKIEKIIPSVIDNFIVTIFEGHQTIALPMNINGTEFRAWYKRKGGVFAKDVLRFSLGQPHGKYVLIKGDKLHCVARLIEEEEELQFKTMKLVDGQIKDRPYMILKKLEEGEKLSSTQRYINETDIELEENEFVEASAITAPDDDIDHHVGSISLFSE